MGVESIGAPRRATKGTAEPALPGRQCRPRREGWRSDAKCAQPEGHSYFFEQHVLRAFPQHLLAEGLQLLLPFDDGEKVVARERAHATGEAARSVGPDDLGLAVATGVEQDVAARRM